MLKLNQVTLIGRPAAKLQRLKFLHHTLKLNVSSAVLFLLFFLANNLSAECPNHGICSGGTFLRPLASSPDAGSSLVPSSGLLTYESNLARIPAIATDHIAPLSKNEGDAWDQTLKNWRKSTGNQLNRIQQILSSNPKNSPTLSSSVSEALSNLEKKFIYARDQYQHPNHGGLIVSSPVNKLAEEITDLFLSYSEAYAALSANTTLSKNELQRLAHTSVLEQLTDGFALSDKDKKQLAPLHKKQIEELLELRDHLMRVGNFEAFAAEFQKGFQKNFRAPNSSSI